MLIIRGLPKVTFSAEAEAEVEGDKKFGLRPNAEAEGDKQRKKPQYEEGLYFLCRLIIGECCNWASCPLESVFAFFD